MTNGVLARLARRSSIEGGCLVWDGKSRKGYGRIKIDGKERAVHRVAWIARHGPIPAGLEVLHHCDNPPCWLDDHLFLGTQADNLADMRAKKRDRTNGNERRMTCSHGHAYPANPRRDKKGARLCLACGRERQQRYRERVALARRKWAHVA